MKTHGPTNGKRYTLDELLAENKKRNDKLFSNYDPVTGEGSLVPRKPININGQTQRWPERMFELPQVQEIEEKGIDGVMKKLGVRQGRFLEELHRLRCRYDYEYWSFTSSIIKNKKGKLVPFLFNFSQRKSIADREKLRAEGKPVWQLEVKDRQYGSSTEKTNYIFWLQNVVYKNHNSYIISLDKDVVTDIVDRYERIAANYPYWMGKISLKGYRGARNTIQIEGAESFIYLGSVERPNAPSGRTVQHVLISEAGKMKETNVKSAEDLITNIVSLVPEEPYTTLLIESTAHKSGTWFRNEAQKALRGESGYRLTFINWMSNHEKWKADYEVSGKQVAVEDFVNSLSAYNWKQWEAGASLEQINWYNMRERKYPYQWQMKQENPTWIEEAFQSNDSRFFPFEYVQNLKKTAKNPALIGNIYSDGTGLDAFSNIHFREEKDGRIWIWQTPEQIDMRKNGVIEVRHQTCAFADVGGRSPDSDKCAITILDRSWLIGDGYPEVVAEYRGNLDTDLFAWEAAKLCYWYHQALLAIEINTLINKAAREGNYEGDGSLTILNEINNVYPNLYARTVHDNRTDKKPTQKLGFHMNRRTKRMLYDEYLKAMRDETYIERSDRAIHEANSIITTSDGKIEAVSGENDDLADTRAGAIWLSSSHMPLPELIKPMKSEKRRREKSYVDI